MDSNKASSLDQFSFVRIPKALPGLTVLMILLSLVFNLVITFSDLLGSSILKQFLTGLEGMGGAQGAGQEGLGVKGRKLGRKW